MYGLFKEDGAIFVRLKPDPETDIVNGRNWGMNNEWRNGIFCCCYHGDSSKFLVLVLVKINYN
jgi:hypothetical protein